MGKYWRCIGHYNGEATTYEAVAGTFQASPYTPDEDARMVGIRLLQADEAATSLVENYQIRLTCTTWKPNTIHVCGNGRGLGTVPASPVQPIDYDMDQPVKAGVPVTIEGRHAIATAVTANILVMGLFIS
jgi:hypothetical protein